MLEWKPDDPNLWAGYAGMLRFLGRKHDSDAAYRRALALDPASGLAWWGLASLDASAIGDADLALLETAVAESSNPALLHFALAQVLDRQGSHAEAFANYRRANDAWRHAHPYDAADLTREADQSIALFDRGFFDQRSGFGAPDAGPVFIVGMPRSGSTLLERMLGRHSRIEATGELPIVARMVDMLSAQPAGTATYPELVAELPATRARELGETYLERAREFRKTAKPLFTDKLHMNWRHLGLIRLMLPGAKVIDVRRDALDCCWSNYKLHFTRGHLASNDLADLGRFYADCARVLDHMHGIAPDVILSVRYEELIDDPARQMRRVLDFLGLEFEDACLDFHRAADPVGTASSEQVRRPLNRDGIGAWKPYERWLGPLIETLGPLAGVA
jgi:tetratricopeptide (TPR) repeat protein